MTNLAIASPARRARRASTLTNGRRNPRRAVVLRPLQEVVIAGTTLQATSKNPSHIKRSHLVLLGIAAVLLHGLFAWYIATHTSTHTPIVKNELALELVSPPKALPPPPKIEPPKPVVKQVVKQAQVLPQIQQAVAEPSTEGVGAEVIAVAPIVAAAAPEPEPVVTAPIGRAGYLNNPPPDYPAIAVRQGWQGTVLLRVRVLSNGKVESVEIKQSSGRKVLDDEAIRTVKQWLFTPSKRGDTAIDGWANVPIEFLLG